MAGHRFGEADGHQRIEEGGASVLPEAWRKSSYSNHQSACVEVSSSGQETVGFRDSKDPNGPVLQFPRTEAAAFLAAVAAGEFTVGR
ncbi:DUF397 domain-containing protein [Streptomyces sp. V4-01]|uniref:DUF397 domain-containing protein n=1 Tax=Actinacidiphila polyblastidii TaxID=3110430 RepID=A0ABU7PDT0_9ACTN|nr:DUF397 domain-containing protein [Streptomyces sp. V4-01]